MESDFARECNVIYYYNFVDRGWNILDDTTPPYFGVETRPHARESAKEGQWFNSLVGPSMEIKMNGLGHKDSR